MKKSVYTVAEAQAVFEYLIARVIKGEEIVLVDGKHRAKLVSCFEPARKQKPNSKKK